MDAGVATGLAINVVQSDMTNLGGVAPIILYLARTGEVLTISGLGWWPKAASVDWFAARGIREFPLGVLRSVVPSALDAWLTALARYGTMTLADVAGPAVDLAERGFPVDIFLHHKIRRNRATLEQLPTLREFDLPNGQAPEVGELLVQRDLAQTLRKLVEVEAGAAYRGREAAIMAARDRFYRGDIAEAIVRFCQEQGGLLTLEDLAEFSVAIEPPVRTTYRGYEVYACGPWCQGPMVPETLNILEAYDLGGLDHNAAEHLNLVAEALKLAFSDRHNFYGDPRYVRVPISGLLDKRYAAERRQMIDPARAWPEMPPGDPWAFEAGRPAGVSTVPVPDPRAGAYQPDTSYLCVVDEEGNGFSITPSDGFTGTPLVPGLGIIISSRGLQSWLEPDHPAAVAPGRRPRLTPNPGIVLKDGTLFMTYGSPGGDVQPQAMVQFLVNMLDFGLNPQEAAEAPRIASFSHPDSFDPHTYQPGLLRAEMGIEQAVVADLERRGHRVERWPPLIPNPGQIPGAVCAVMVDRTRGVLMGAADPRGMSHAIGW